jgi:hypothetical protein
VDSLITCRESGREARVLVLDPFVQPGDAQFLHWLRAELVQTRVGYPEHLPVCNIGLAVDSLAVRPGHSDVADGALDGQESWLGLPDLRLVVVAGFDGNCCVSETQAKDSESLETSRPGVFAAGDVRSGSIKRVASAVGEGSMTVQFVHEYLKQM